MNAIIISIGDELVLGQTVDTNSAWLSQQLAAVGCAARGHVTVGDDQSAIEQAIREAGERCDVILVSGGIGPTPDDLTRQALAAVMGVELEMNQQWLDRLDTFFKHRGRAMPEMNKIQAMIPRGARMIDNTAGTAAGIEAELKIRYDRTRPPRICRVFVMPGVPKEMKIMFERDVLPQIRQGGNGACILSRTLHTFGLGESAVAERLGELMRRDRNPSVGTTVSQGIVSVRVNARFEPRDIAERELETTVAACRDALGDLIFGQDDDTLASVVGQLLRSRRGSTVATAESCTGGLLSKMLTDVAGSSAYFTHGWVTYANEAKQAMLDVPADLIVAYGAVSEPVVTAMAEGARRRAGASYALAISGIAGPEGGTPQKPVGTTCIAIVGDGADTTARTFNFPGDREMIRDRAAKMALAILRFQLLGTRMPF